MTRSWVFTSENELDSETAVVQTKVDDESKSATITVITNEPGQYKAKLLLNNDDISSNNAIFKESKNYLKENEWNSTLKFVLLGEFDPTKDDSFYDSIAVKWSSSGDEKLVLSIKQIYSMNKNTTATIGLGKINCSVTSRGSSQKALDKLIQIDHDFYTNMSAVWKRDMYRKETESIRLEKQVQELVEAKKEYDEEILSRFALILNAKKSKIAELSGEGSLGSNDSAVKRRMDSDGTKEDEVQVKEEPESCSAAVKDEPMDYEGGPDTPSRSDEETSAGETDSGEES